MKKVYYLSTCSTSKRIINDFSLRDIGFQFQDIKTEAITADQLEQMKEMAGSYEALFSRIARKYKELGLKDRNLSEQEYRDFILDEYTFLKRPVIILDKKIFVGSGKANLNLLGEALD